MNISFHSIPQPSSFSLWRKQCYQLSNYTPRIFYAYVNKYICIYSPPLLSCIYYNFHHMILHLVWFLKIQHLKWFHIVTKIESSLIFMASECFFEWLYKNLFNESSIARYVGHAQSFYIKQCCNKVSCTNIILYLFEYMYSINSLKRNFVFKSRLPDIYYKLHFVEVVPIHMLTIYMILPISHTLTNTVCR